MRTTSLAAALVAALVGGLAITLPAIPAAAQSSPAGSSAGRAAPTKAQQQEAATRFKKGLELFKDGDAQAALIEFRRAYELAPNFNVLYNIGQVSFQLQDYPGALSALERYLAEGGSSVPAGRRGDVQKDIDKLKTRVANVELVTTVPDAEITINDVTVGKTPFTRPILVSAGRRKITVSRPGFTASTKIIEIASGDQLKVPIDPVEIRSAPPPTSDQPKPAEQPPPSPVVSDGGSPPAPPPPLAPASRPVPVAGIVVTGGLTVAAVVTGVLALGASSDLATQRTSPSATRDSLDSAQSKTKALALTTDILTGGAVVSLGITLIVGLTGKKEAAPQSGSTPKPPGSGLRTFLTHASVGAGPGGARFIGSF